MNFFALLIPLLFLAVFLYALKKKVKIYHSFTRGVKDALPLLVSIFPYLAAILMLSALFQQSGLSAWLCNFLAPAFEFLGVPKEVIKLILIKPFSGSGSTALLSELLQLYGADSYICRCAAVCYGSSETVFYVGAVYFSQTKNKNFTAAIVISLLSSLIAVVFGCFFCRFL